MFQDGELWYHQFALLDICACGRTRKESADAFSEHFSSIWQWIAQTEDGGLGPEAVELKREISKLVQSVETLDYVKLLRGRSGLL